MKWQEIYQKIYEEKICNYGQERFNHCMGIKLYPHYKHFLKGKVIAFGCGTGEEVEFLREKGYNARGIDFIKYNENMDIGDITVPRDYTQYDTAICIEVFEHLDNKGIKGLLNNLVQAKRQVITIANDESWVEVDGKKIDLHINKKPFKTWRAILMDRLDIIEEIVQKDERRVYLCQKKQDVNKESIEKIIKKEFPSTETKRFFTILKNNGLKIIKIL